MTDINLFIDQALSRFDIKDEATISAIRNSFTNSDPGSLGAILETLNGKSATVVGASELILYGGADTFYSNTSTGTNVHTGAIAEEYAALSSSRALLKNTEAYQWIRTTQTISASGKIEYAPGGGNVAISDYVKTSGLFEASGNLERAIADIYDRVISERFVMEAPSSSTVTAFNGVGDTLIVNAVELPSAVSRGFVINNVSPSIYAGMPQQVLNQTFSIEGHSIATNTLGNEFTTHTLENINDTYIAKAVDTGVIGSKVDYPAEMINKYIALKNQAESLIDFNDISDRLGSTDAATRSSALGELNDFFTKSPVGKALRGAGEALIVYDAITTGLAANRQAELGNYDLAGEMISKLASRISAGVLGAEIGALLGVSMYLSMMAEGATAGSVLGPWGIAIGALCGLAGAIALSPVGDKIGSTIWDTVRLALKNLNLDPNTAGKWLAEHNLLHPVVVDPLVIDLAGNGFELIAASASSVQMDMNGNGYAEKIGWVKGSEGLLVIDRDNNGSIEGPGDLFGSATQDGFDVLRALDSNNDNMISAADTQFSSLRIWQDINEDGIAQSGEIKTLSEIGVASINLATMISGQQVAGNTIANVSSVTMTDGTTRKIGSAYFATEPLISQWIAPAGFVIDATAAKLPELEGFGIVKNLSAEMTLDTALKSQVIDLMENCETMSGQQLRAAFEQILLNWTDADGVNSSGRGQYVDAKHLAVIEHIYGSTYVETVRGVTSSNPGAAFASGLENLYQDMLNGMMTTFFAQLAISKASITDTSNNLLVSKFWPLALLTGSSTESFEAALSYIKDSEPTDTEAACAYYEVMASVLKGVAVNVFGGDYAQLKAIYSQVLDPVYSHFAGLVTDGRSINFATAVGGTITGTNDADIIVDVSGGNTLIGNAGDDILIGGSGNDILSGLWGNDTYYIRSGDGNDIIDDGGNWTGNDDRVILGSGLNSSNVNVSFVDADMTLTFTGFSNTILFYQADANADRGIESVTFGNGETWSRTAFMDRYVIQQEMSGAVTIHGTGSDNTIHGNSADNVLNGQGGNDTYYYNIGDGNDIIDDGGNWTGNNDRLILGTGLNSSNVNVSFVGADMTLTFTGYSGSLVLYQADARADRGIEWVTFGNGEIWSREQFMPLFIQQQEASGAVSIYGTGIDNVFHGNSANNILYGGAGDDTYNYNAGDGNDTINEDASWIGAADKVIFGSGLTSQNVNISFSGWDATLTFSGYSGSLQIIAQTFGRDIGIEQFVFSDGVTWSRTDLVEHCILQQEASGAVSIYGTNDNNVIRGNSASNVLYGGAGNDTYYYNAGNGNDTINEDASWTGAADKVIFGSGLTSQNVNISFSGWDATLTFSGYSGALQIIAQTFGRDIGIEQFVFSDGVTWSRQDLIDQNLIEQQEALGAAALYGTASDNVFHGNTANNSIYGYDGNDIIGGGAGNDIIVGGSGNDVITGDAGNDTADYSASTSSILVNLSTVSQTLNATAVAAGTARDGLGGTDTLSTVESIVGSSSDDWIYGSSVANTLTGGAGNDTINGDAGDDTINGDDGNDYLNGDAGNDILSGGAGNDTLIGWEVHGEDDDYVEPESDTLYGGAGDDTYQINAYIRGDQVIESANEGTDTVWVMDGGNYTLADNVENAHLYWGGTLNGNGLDNQLFASDTGNAKLYGNGGNDTLNGNYRADLLDGGAGDDNLNGGLGNDILLGGNGLDTLNGGSGDDTLNGGAGSDYLDGNGGFDTLDYSDSPTAVYVNYSPYANQLFGGHNLGARSGWDGWDSIDTYAVSFEKIVGSAFGDIILGSENNDAIYGGAGNDDLQGSYGSDTLFGDSGNDKLFGGRGTINDILNGGDGNDTADFSVSTGTIYVNLSSTSQSVNGTTVVAGTAKDGYGSTDTLISIESVSGVVGYSNNVWGSASANTITTSSASDWVYGEAGNDIVSTGAGADILIGGTGNDALNGGTGNDQYKFGLGDGADTIADYDTTVGNTDVVSFGSGIGQQSLWFSQSGNNLIVNVMGTTDSITVSDWYSGSAYDVEQFATTDGMKLDSQLAQLVTAMASYAANNSGFNPTSATVMPTDTTLQTAITAAWHA